MKEGGPVGVARIEYEAGSFTVVMDGLDRVWTLRHRITVPYQSVISVSWDVHHVAAGPEEIRFPGTGFPGVITAGTYWRFWGEDRVRSFWLRGRDPRNCMTVRLRDHAFDYITVEVEHPEAEVARLSAAVQEHQRGGQPARGRAAAGPSALISVFTG
jgi:hypothetical protein